jgi:hypothetical protein
MLAVILFGFSIQDVRIDRHNTPHAGVWIFFRGRVFAHLFARPEFGSVQFHAGWPSAKDGAVFHLINMAVGRTSWFQIGR